MEHPPFGYSALVETQIMSHLLGKKLLFGLWDTHEQMCNRLMQYPSGICTCLLPAE